MINENITGNMITYRERKVFDRMIDFNPTVRYYLHISYAKT